MFKFKGISSIDMKVVIEEEEHFLGRAARRYEKTEIDGRDGAIFDELGYSVIERPIKVQILDLNKLDLILAWLDGEGELEYKGRITTARFYEEVIPKRSSAIKIAEFNFIRDPFWLKKNDEFVQIDNLAYNAGNVISRPLIRLEKGENDSVDITVNSVRFVYNFNDEEYVEMDCEDKTILYEGLTRTRQIEMDYEYPYLDIGENSVAINSGDSTIYIKRKDRWL